jgi:UDP-N-acetylmuramyl tripeptide synthase
MEEIHDLEFERNVKQNFIQKDEANFRDDAYNRPPTLQNYANNHRTCVKIHEQKSSVVLGDETYNYWEELRK